MAQLAADQGAHVAVLMYYRSAYELATQEPEADAAGIVATAVNYADRLKKPIDRLAVFEWASGIAPSEDLDAKIDKLKEGKIE